MCELDWWIKIFCYPYACRYFLNSYGNTAVLIIILYPLAVRFPCVSCCKWFVNSYGNIAVTIILYQQGYISSNLVYCEVRFTGVSCCKCLYTTSKSLRIWHLISNQKTFASLFDLKILIFTYTYYISFVTQNTCISEFY